jgi:hypothetical protein
MVALGEATVDQMPRLIAIPKAADSDAIGLYHRIFDFVRAAGALSRATAQRPDARGTANFLTRNQTPAANSTFQLTAVDNGSQMPSAASDPEPIGAVHSLTGRYC